MSLVHAAIFGLGTPELLIILVIVVLIFAPKSLPLLGRMLGDGVRSLKQGLSGDEGKDEKDDAGRK